MTLDDLETPALILDEARLDANIRKMQEKLSKANVNLRPHLKTCKSLPIARKIVPPQSNSGITVSTLAEAEYFFEAGYTDILYAVSIVPHKLKRVKALQDKGAVITLLLDTQVSAVQTAEIARDFGTLFPCLIEIDCDGKRAGLKPDDKALIEIAKYLDQTENVHFSGIMTHAGGSYYCSNPSEITLFAEQERRAITDAADKITAAGITCSVISMGSTPTATFADHFDGVTEVRAGVYVFQDMVMQALGVCEISDIAISVLATVISHNLANNRLLIDAGSLALSADPGKLNSAGDRHFGQVCTLDTTRPIQDLYVNSTNQEHGLISLENTAYTFDDFPIGSRLRVLPNHACITAAAYPGYHVIRPNSDLTTYWPRCNGW